MSVPANAVLSLVDAELAARPIRLAGRRRASCTTGRLSPRRQISPHYRATRPSLASTSPSSTHTRSDPPTNIAPAPSHTPAAANEIDGADETLVLLGQRNGERLREREWGSQVGFGQGRMILVGCWVGRGAQSSRRRCIRRSVTECSVGQIASKHFLALGFNYVLILVGALTYSFFSSG
jgi:hypothetical protein